MVRVRLFSTLSLNPKYVVILIESEGFAQEIKAYLSLTANPRPRFKRTSLDFRIMLVSSSR